MEIVPVDVKLKQCPVDQWTTREQLCLTSAVSQSGDQNWGIVSRAIRQLTTETGRPLDWYSTKNCALQYTKLLEQVEIPKRKREKSEELLNETPGEIVTKMLTEKRVEELKGILEEEKASYLQLKKEILHLESNQLDNRLHQFWDEIMREQEMEDEEANKLQEFLKEREEKIKLFQAVTKIQTSKAQPPTLQRKPAISDSKRVASEATKLPNTSEDSVTDSVKMEVVEGDERSQARNSLDSPVVAAHSSPSRNSSSTSAAFAAQVVVREKTPEGEKSHPFTNIKVEDEDRILEEEEEEALDEEEDEVEEPAKTPEEVHEELKCDSSFETNITLDYTSNLNVNVKDQGVIAQGSKKLLDSKELTKTDLQEIKDKSEAEKQKLCPAKLPLELNQAKPLCEEVMLEGVKNEETEDSFNEEMNMAEKRDLVNKDDEQDEDDIDEESHYKLNGREDQPVPRLHPKEGAKMREAPDSLSKREVLSPDTTTMMSCGVSFMSESLPVLPLAGSPACEKKSLKKEGRDEYDFDDDASRESLEVKEFMNRGEKRKFSPCDTVSSPVVSESTPSSPASTSYGDDPEAEKLHRSWKRSIMLIWNDIAAHKNASLFLKPIMEDKVPGYHSIVFRPIDLMTIKRNIESGVIRSTSDFQRDVMLMFLNANMYNPRNSDVFRMAHHMMNDGVEIMEEFINAQMLAKVVETPQKTLRRETRESSAKRVVEDLKRKREEREEKVKRRKI